jgi:hypothetical protein
LPHGSVLEALYRVRFVLQGPEGLFEDAAPEVLWTNEQGVLYLTIGGVQTEQGMGWMDHAVLFCPFCGTKLQTKEDVRLKAGSPPVQ